MKKKMYGDEVQPSISSYEHADPEPPPLPRHKTRHNELKRHPRSTLERPGLPRKSRNSPEYMFKRIDNK